MKNLIVILCLSLSLIACQSTRQSIQQQVRVIKKKVQEEARTNQNFKDQFPVFASLDEVYYFKVDCLDGDCEVKECSDKTYSHCPISLGKCNHKELKVLTFESDNNSTLTEVAICPSMKERFEATLREIGLKQYANLHRNEKNKLKFDYKAEGQFEGVMNSDDLAKAIDRGYRLDMQNRPRIIEKRDIETARCVYAGPDAASFRFDVDHDRKLVKLVGPAQQRPGAVTCTLPKLSKPINFI